MPANQERISTSGLWALMFNFYIASAVTVPIGAVAGHDVWISILLAMLVGGCMVWVISHLCQSYPGQSLIEIAEQLVGKWVARGIGLLYVWYSFHLGALVMRDFVEFIASVGLPRTPIVAILIPILLLAIWGMYLGIEVLSRLALTVYLFVLLEVIVSTILLIQQMDFQNLLPIMEKGWSPVIEGTIQITAFPFGESVVFVMIFPYLNQGQKTKKTAILALIVAGFLLLLIHVRNLVLFGDMAQKMTYPTFTAYQYVSLFDFLERVEPLSIITWILGGFLEISVCLFASLQSLVQVTQSKKLTTFAIPVALLMAELSRFIYQNHAELIETAANAWPWYSIPFQVGIPLLLLVVMWMRRKKKAVFKK